MYQKAEASIKWLEFDLLAEVPHLKHAVLLRHGGESQGPFKSLNLSDELGDHPGHVQANLAKVKSLLQQGHAQPIQLHWAKQCHGKTIKCITAHTREAIPQCDTLMTNIPGQALMIKHADCQAAIFYDPVHQAIATSHAGWRGSILNIYEATIQAMQQVFHSKPADLLVCISPSLGPEEAEFINYTQELPPEFWSFQCMPNYFDFWAISEYQLQQAGILPHHIEIARLSTYANSYDYFSYRRDKVTGRHGTCAMLC